jgi:hypothetical protein
MVTRSKKAGAKKSRVRVGKLKLNKETVKNLSGNQQRDVKGGLRPRGGDDTKLLGTCTILIACH